MKGNLIFGLEGKKDFFTLDQLERLMLRKAGYRSATGVDGCRGGHRGGGIGPGVLRPFPKSRPEAY